MKEHDDDLYEYMGKCPNGGKHKFLVNYMGCCCKCYGSRPHYFIPIFISSMLFALSLGVLAHLGLIK